MSNIYCQFNHLYVENDVGEYAKDIHFLLRKGETVFFLGDRDSGRSVFFDYLLGKANKVRGNIYQDKDRISFEVLNKDIKHISYEETLNRELEMISILDYLFLLQSSFSLVIWDSAKQNELAKELLSFVGLDKDITIPIGELNHSERILLGLAKAKAEKATMILIEDDFENIYEEELKRIGVIFDKFKQEGVTFVVNTNGLYGIKELSDRCAIFSNHILARILNSKETDSLVEIENALYSDVIEFPSAIHYLDGKEVFRLEAYQLRNGEALSFSLCEQEVISIIDEDYSEIKDLYKTLSGQVMSNGKMFFQGESLKPGWNKDIVKTPIVGIDALGIKRLFPQLSVAENLALPSYQKLNKGSGILSPSVLSATYTAWNKQHPYSGDSIQKMSRADRLSIQLESWWIFHPKVIIFFEPFLHMDQQGRGVIAQYFAKYKERRTAIIVLTGSKNNYLGDDVIALEDRLFDHVMQISERIR